MAAGAAAGGRAALASKGPGGGPCKLSAAQVGELEAVLAAGPAAWGWDEDQRWTLTRIAEVIRRRFMVDYTLAGLDLLLPDRLERAGSGPQASERDEERVTAWKQETWPVITGGLAGNNRAAADLAPGWSSKTSPARA